MISNEITYFLLLLFGAFAVGVHAYGLYGTPLSSGDSSNEQRLSPVLDSVSLNCLGGPRAYTAGLLCYLAINEFLFLVLSSSSVILELSLTVIGGDRTVGAFSLDDATLNPLTPILASQVIMTIGQIRPFSQIEHAIRRISHHVAGIPANVFETVNRINGFEFDTNERAPRSDAVADASRLADKVKAAAIAAGLEQKQADDLANDILHLMSVRHWTYGANGTRMWASRNLRAVKQAIAFLRPRVEILEDRLKGLTSDTAASAPGAKPPEFFPLAEWQSVVHDSADLRHELNEVLAVLIINQPTAKAPPHAPQVNRLLDHVRHREQSQEINALFGSALLGLALSLVFLLAYFLLTSLLRDVFGWLLSLLRDDEPLVVEGKWNYVVASVQRSIEYSVRELANFGVIFVVASGVALSVRATRLAGNEWTPWTERVSPFRQYLSVAFMASVIAFLFYTLMMFYNLVISPSLKLDSEWLAPTLLEDFRAQFADHLLLPLTGFACAWVICLMTDRDSVEAPDAESARGASRWLDATVATTALRFALICGAFNMFLRIHTGSVTQTFQVTEALFVPTIVYFLCFHTYGVLHRGSERAMRAYEVMTGTPPKARTDWASWDAPLARASPATDDEPELAGAGRSPGPAAEPGERSPARRRRSAEELSRDAIV